MRLTIQASDFAQARALIQLCDPTTPDQLIPQNGLPSIYMRRWFIRRDKERGNIYLHNILRSDDDRALHDHPWSSLSMILEGSYLEHTPAGVVRCDAGRVIRRKADAQHRLELIDGAPCWTLFITGPKVREWGFHCQDGWVHWSKFDGRGCSQ
jgi:hypothetical protein